MIMVLKKERRIIIKNARFEFARSVVLKILLPVDWQVVTDYSKNDNASILTVRQ
jgi:hypothetical protein